MCKKFTPEELNTMGHDANVNGKYFPAKNDLIFQMQERLDKMERDYETLMEQIRLANQQKYGRSTEKLDEIAGQLSFFNEAEANYDESVAEPAIEETVINALKPVRKAKQKGQREEDLKEFPQEEILHDISARES